MDRYRDIPRGILCVYIDRWIDIEIYKEEYCVYIYRDRWIDIEIYKEECCVCTYTERDG